MNDYPTESELEQLKMLGDDWKNPQGVIDFLKRIWNWDDFVEVMGKKVIRLSTCEPSNETYPGVCCERCCRLNQAKQALAEIDKAIGG